VRLWRGHRGKGHDWGCIHHHVPRWHEICLPSWTKLYIKDRVDSRTPPAVNYNDAAAVATAMTSLFFTAFEEGEGGNHMTARLTSVRASHRWRTYDYKWWMRFYEQCMAIRACYQSRDDPEAEAFVQEAVKGCTAKGRVTAESFVLLILVEDLSLIAAISEVDRKMLGGTRARQGNPLSSAHDGACRGVRRVARVLVRSPVGHARFPRTENQHN